jgi:peptidoglycan L-alanyl-D-glutamate endopeptidase CwlK
MSRALEDLEPVTQGLARTFLGLCQQGQLDVIVTCTRRTMDEQAALYAQGRTRPGRIVTWAPPGSSPHNYGMALDVVAVRDGKAVWDDADPVWATLGDIGITAGLEWGGHFPSGKIDKPHFQRPDWRTFAGVSP